MTDFAMKFGVKERISVYTWYHGVESLEVLVGHATLITHFIYKAVNEAHHRVSHV